MDALDFEYHENHYRRLCGNANAWDYFRGQALAMHILSVQDALRHALYTSATASDSLTDDDAKYYLCFGVGRRLGALSLAFRGVSEIAPLDREIPLSVGEVQSVDRDLNTIYINILGIMDNWAWCLRHECKSEKVKRLPDIEIGLFKRRFKTDPEFEALRPDIDTLKDWFEDLRTRRDPAAHRIPLTVPPAHLNDNEEEQRNAIQEKINDAIRNRDYDRIDGLEREQEQVGQFMHVFYHHPDGPYFNLYPTIPQDIGNLIKVTKSVQKFLGVE